MKNTILHLLIGLLLCCSCNDWLDVKPKAEKEANELFETETGFKNALIACYIDLNASDLYGKSLVATDIEFLAQHWDLGVGNYGGAVPLKKFDYKSSYAESLFKRVYSKLYNVIVQANSVLSYLPEKGEVIRHTAVRGVIEGEALAIRAFCHMEILRLFGQIPQHATVRVALPYAEEVSILPPSYLAFDMFVDKIFRDLDAALALFKEHDPVLKFGFAMLDQFNGNLSGDVFLNCRRFRFNYYAVQALKARLFLYLGKKSEAWQLASELISPKSGAYSRLSLGGDADFKAENYALPSECILALSNPKIEKNMDEFNRARYYMEMKHYEELFAGQSMSSNNRALKVWDKDNMNIMGNQFAKFLKYKQPVNSVGSEKMGLQKQVVPLIRLSEIYLIAIETAPTLEEANRLYIEYMKARNVVAVPLVAQTLMEEVMMEYQREFYGEGVMFYVYKRLNAKEMKWKTDRPVVEQDYIIPLPATELKK